MPPNSAQTISTGPGGISLSRAAAQKLSLNFDIDGASFSDGRIVLSGQQGKNGIDAAIFLTSLRLACEPGDPSFSLDPDDGQAWVDEGQAIGKRMWEQVNRGIRPNSGKQTFSVRTFSASRDFPRQWRAQPAHPNFKTRLVFEPAWLGQTRLGEILYKADVLLKELTVGAPLIRREQRVRAAAVNGYIPSHSRNAARYLLELVERGDKKTGDRAWQGHRLWFDLVTQDSAPGKASVEFPRPSTDAGKLLYGRLQQIGYAGDGLSSNSFKASQISESGNAIDLSQVFPQMFIRRHDSATGKDLPGHDPDLDLLAADVNQQTQRYAAAYSELKDLVDVFRAYLVASKYVTRYPRVCAQANALPLLDTERPASPLPEHHASELFFTVAFFENSRRWISGSVTSISGGIAMRGKTFATQRTVVNQPTPVTAEFQREIEANQELTTWRGTSGKQFVALKLDDDDWVAPPQARTRPTPAVPIKPAPSPPIDIPVSSGTLDRFNLFEGARITGTKIKSTNLQTKYASDPKAARDECIKVCSSDSNCVAFEIEQSNNRCHAYSTVQKSHREPNWSHGIWQ